MNGAGRWRVHIKDDATIEYVHEIEEGKGFEITLKIRLFPQSALVNPPKREEECMQHGKHIRIVWAFGEITEKTGISEVVA